MRQLIMLAVSAMIAGCSTAPVQPAISAFATSVEKSTAEVEQRYKADKIADKYSAEFDRAVVDAQAVLQQDGCSAPIGLSVDPGSEALSDFSAHCDLTAVVLDPTAGALSEIVIVVPDGQDGVEGENARRAAAALSRYATSIKALAETNLPGELGDKFGAAATSVNGLIGEVAKLGDGKGLEKDTIKVLDTGASLFGTLFTEAFEVRRYALLKKLVERADPSVALSARVIAAWYKKSEDPDLDAKYNELDEVAAVQATAIVAIRGGSIDKAVAVAAAVAATETLRNRYRIVEEAETKAKWRVFIGIASAHEAILKSFNKPKSLEDLATANDRILDLVAKTDAFVKAVEEAGQE